MRALLVIAFRVPGGFGWHRSTHQCDRGHGRDVDRKRFVAVWAKYAQSVVLEEQQWLARPYDAVLARASSEGVNGPPNVGIAVDSATVDEFGCQMDCIDWILSIQLGNPPVPLFEFRPPFVAR